MEPQPQEIIDRIAAEVPSIKDLLNCRLAFRQFLESRELTARLAQSPEFGVAYGSPKYSKLPKLLSEKSTINSLINSLTVWASSKCNESEEDGFNTLFSKVLPKLRRLRKLSLHNVAWSRLQNAGRDALLELYHLEELELFNCTFPDINVLLAMISVQKPGTLFLDIDSISLECPGTAVAEGRSLTTVRELVLGRSVADHDVITRFSELKPQLEQLSLYYASEESVCWIQPLLYSSGERLKEVMIEGLWPCNPENPIVLSFDQNRALTCLELRFYDSGPAGYIEIPHDVVATLAKVNTCLKEITLCFALEEEEDRVIEQIAPRNFDMFEHVLIEKFGRSQMPTVSVCVNYMEGDLMEEFQRMMYKDTPELHSLGKITVSETGWI